MKISVSLPDEDVAFLDRHAAEHGIPSRSAALQRAVELLRAHGLGTAYADAWSGAIGDEGEDWEAPVPDGIGGR